jgi:hypothetical protein
MNTPRGLLSGLEDPAIMARLEERDQLVDRIAVKTGYNRRTAGSLLREFETAVPGDFGLVN